MQRIESRYHDLLRQQAEVAEKVGTIRQHLADASTLIHAVLMVNNEEQILQSKDEFKRMQLAFDANLRAIYPLITDQGLALDTVRTQGSHMFASGQRVIQANIRWRNDRALLVLAHSFTPALSKLHEDVDTLRHDAQQAFADKSHELTAQTQATIRKANWSGYFSVLLISAWTAWIAWYFVSRPIGRLTRSMHRMSLHEYDTPIADQTRSDEIGSMARALKSFATALQDAKKLEATLLVHQKNDLLTDQLRQLTSALPGAVFQMRLQPGEPIRLRFVSPQWTQLMGVDKAIHHNVEAAAQLIRHHDAEVTRISEQHYLESAQTLQPVDFVVQMHMLDGVHRWIKTRANPHREADGSTTFNGVWLDVTKEIMQARALEKAKRQAEQSASETTTLQASISHEIRTPLNAILGLTQLLLKADLPEAQREQLNNVLRASQHLRGIINEVLDFTKIDAGQLKLESTDFSLENVVLDVIRMCREEAHNKGLSLHYKMAREVPDSLRGDPHRIAQILLNYVNNAIKFTTDGDIHIAVRLDASSTLHRIVLHCSVKDTGPGIPADRIPLIFQAFQQADNSITRRFGGTGLGLTISRELAHLMGGAAGVHSTLGQGSSFWFTAALEPARTRVLTDQPQLQPAQVLPAQWQGLRVLVVDDNPLNRAVAQGMLHALGVQSELAEDGAQALLKLQAVGPSYFSCVLMDLQMPHMDGISATKALRQWPEFTQLPVIAMTAHTGLHDVDRTQAAGMNAHLSKPLLESSLHAVLQEWLGTKAPQGVAATTVDTPLIPTEFDPAAIDALAQFFPLAKLQQLVDQFSQGSLQRAQQLPSLAQQHDWQAMRAETHKLSGTAATFGLMRLGQLSNDLSHALKAADADTALRLAQQVDASAQTGMTLLLAYCAALHNTA